MDAQMDIDATNIGDIMADVNDDIKVNLSRVLSLHSQNSDVLSGRKPPLRQLSSLTSMLESLPLPQQNVSILEGNSFENNVDKRLEVHDTDDNLSSSKSADPAYCDRDLESENRDEPDDASKPKSRCENAMDTGEASATSSATSGAGETTSTTSATDRSPAAIEIIISFDTTGSMSFCLDEVKARINDMIQRLFSDIPSLQIGVIAHGDYCDESVYYLHKSVNLTNDTAQLCDFVSNVEGTGGGDFAECYELILKNLRSVVWTPGSQRAIILIGDACPHTPEQLSEEGREVIDWKDEARQLYHNQGVKIYGVQCLNHPEAGTFWKDISELTGGEHVRLDRMDSIVDILMAICYREGGSHFLHAYEKEVRAREGRMLAPEIDSAFGALRKDNATASTSSKPLSLETRIKKLNGAAKKKRSKPVAVIKPSKTAPNSITLDSSSKLGGTVSAKPKRILMKNNRAKVQKGDSTQLQRTKQQSNCRQRLAREKVTRNNFALNNLAWTKWYQFSSTDKYQAVVTKFKEHCTCPAVYEIAVQPGPGFKRYVVYAKVTNGVLAHSLKRAIYGRIHTMIDKIQGQSTDITFYIRRAVLSKKQGSKNSVYGLDLFKTHSYLWNEHLGCKRGSMCLRKLERNGVSLC